MTLGAVLNSKDPGNAVLNLKDQMEGESVALVRILMKSRNDGSVAPADVLAELEAEVMAKWVAVVVVAVKAEVVAEAGRVVQQGTEGKL
jgi:hypothetical protein